MLSRKLLVSGVASVVLTLGALGGAVGSASASAGAAAVGRSAGPPVHAGNRQPAGTTYIGEIKNYNSNLCLGISAGAVDGDAVQATCNLQAKDQLWTEGVPVADGYYRLYNDNGQCLGVSAGQTSNGSYAVATPCLGGHDDQLWLFNYGATPSICGNDVYAPIFNEKATGKVLGVDSNSTLTGAHAVIWVFQKQCNNQLWAHTAG